MNIDNEPDVQPVPPKPAGNRTWEWQPLRIVLTYVFVAGAWITFSDYIMQLSIHDAHLYAELSSIKGWLFVILTGMMLYAMIRRYASSQNEIENSLRTSKERLSLITGTTPANICELDSEGRVLFMNRPFDGLTDHYAVGTEFISWLSEDQHDRVRNIIDDVFMTKASQAFQFQLSAPEGATRVFSATMTTVEHNFTALLTATDITERENAEQARRQAEEQIHLQAHFLNTIGQAVIATTVDGTITYWNEAAKMLYGWTADEAIGQGIMFIIPGGPSQDQAQEIMKQLRQGMSWAGEFMVHRRDGTPFYAMVTDTPIYDGKGDLIGIIGVSMDVTGRRRAEEEVRLSNERFQLFARATDEVVRDWDIASDSLWWNETLEKRYAYHGDDLRDLEGWQSHIHPDDRERVKKSFQVAMELRVPTWSEEYRFLHADGTYAYVLDRAYLVCDEKGVPVRVVNSMLDITTLKLAELDQRYLADERDRLLKQLRLQFERMPIGYILLDAHLKVIEWNPAAEKIFGFAKEEAVGSPAFDLIVPPSLKGFVSDFIETLKLGDQTLNAVNENITRGGRTITCEWFDTPLRDEDGRFAGIMAMCLDITERRKADQQLSDAVAYSSAIIDRSPMGITTYKASGEVVTVNEAQARILGTPLEQLRNHNFRHLENWKELGLLDTAIAALETGCEQEIETRGNTSFRTDVWLSCRFVPFQYGHESRLLVLMTDATERKRAEAVLRESEERLRKLSGYLQKIREEERKRIALEIHDELGQQLTVLKIEASLVQKAALRFDRIVDTGPLLERASALSATIDAAIATVRRIATELRPGILDKLGLVDALQWQTREFEKRTCMRCTFTTTIPERHFEEEVAITLFRIFQESLTNIARHSGASRVDVGLTEQGDDIELLIEDNGRGITGEELATATSLGLLGMTERARLLGGHATITGTQGKGTAVRVRLRQSETAPVQ